jgi:hypothetical protein
MPREMDDCAARLEDLACVAFDSYLRCDYKALRGELSITHKPPTWASLARDNWNDALDCWTRADAARREAADG